MALGWPPHWEMTPMHVLQDQYHANQDTPVNTAPRTRWPDFAQILRDANPDQDKGKGKGTQEMKGKGGFKGPVTYLTPEERAAMQATMAATHAERAATQATGAAIHAPTIAPTETDEAYERNRKLIEDLSNTVAQATQDAQAAVAQATINSGSSEVIQDIGPHVIPDADVPMEPADQA